MVKVNINSIENKEKKINLLIKLAIVFQLYSIFFILGSMIGYYLSLGLTLIPTIYLSIEENRTKIILTIKSILSIIFSSTTRSIISIKKSVFSLNSKRIGNKIKGLDATNEETTQNIIDVNRTNKEYQEIVVLAETEQLFDKKLGKGDTDLTNNEYDPTENDLVSPDLEVVAQNISSPEESSNDRALNLSMDDVHINNAINVIQGIDPEVEVNISSKNDIESSFPDLNVTEKEYHELLESDTTINTYLEDIKEMLHVNKQDSESNSTKNSIVGEETKVNEELSPEEKRKKEERNQQQFNSGLENLDTIFGNKVNSLLKKQGKEARFSPIKTNKPSNVFEDWDIWNKQKETSKSDLDFDSLSKIEFFCELCSNKRFTFEENELTDHSSEQGPVPIYKLKLRHTINNEYHLITIRVDIKHKEVVAKPSFDKFINNSTIPNPALAPNPRRIHS